MRRIMIIRHAEKHHDGSPDRGVSIDGIHTKHELTVRGWQRAGALVRFFAPVEGLHAASPVWTPRTIFASAATRESPSRRAIRTVEPLAQALEIPVDVRFQEGDEVPLAAAARTAPSPVLIAWHHTHIAQIVHAIAGAQAPAPPRWPDDRFDVVWILERDEAGDGPWTFTQVAQRLMASDRPDPI